MFITDLQTIYKNEKDVQRKREQRVVERKAKYNIKYNNGTNKRKNMFSSDMLLAVKRLMRAV